jgi:putative nucleotidyltransferase with HDIG domain
MGLSWKDCPSVKSGSINMTIPKTILHGIDRLEPLPLTAQRLMTELQDAEGVHIGRIVSIIEYDQAAVSNLLKVANSAAYAGDVPIVELHEAAIRLGTARLLDIVLGSHLKRLKISAPMYDLSENELWLHSTAASLAVRAIEKETRNSEIQSLGCVAALLHDIGKLIMVRYLEADVALLSTRCREHGITFVEAEREFFGCDHADVGGAIGRKWGFPEEIASAIEHHHDYPVESADLLLNMVIVANLAAKSIGTGLGAEGMNIKVDLSVCRERLGLSCEGFERVCAQTAVDLNNLKKTVGYTSP